MNKILVSFIIFLSPYALASSFENFPILKGDIESVSLNNSKDLSNSVIDIMKNFTDESELDKIKKTLSKPDNLNINPVNYSEFSSLLPMPSDSIIRIINNNFSSEGLYNFFEYDFKEDIILSYGESINIKFEVIEVSPSINLKNTITTGAITRSLNLPAKKIGADTFLLASAASVPLLFSAGLSNNPSPSSSSSENLDTSTYETSEYNKHYGLASINASHSYARGYTGNGITVSVMDNTFDTDHPDLVNVFTTGYNALDASTDVHCEGNTAMNGGNNTGCSNSHGTHVAGTIAANKDDSEMHGVAYSAKIKPIVMADGSWDSSSLTTAKKILGIQNGTGSGIVAMNNSWGIGTTATITISATTYHYNLPYATNALSMGTTEKSAWENASSDTVIVFANGNDGMNITNGRVSLYPTANDARAGTNGVGWVLNSTNMNVNRAGWYGSQGVVNSNLTGKWLTVVALDSTNTIATYSNGCADAKNYCICAPGSSVYSTIDTVEGSNYASKNGTSMAAPHVTAAVAILKQQFPNLSSTQLVTLLIDSATDLGASGVDATYGVGMLNLAEATKPSGSAFVAAKNANTANGGTMGTPTPSSSSINFSSPFGNSFSNKNLSLGYIDSFKRSYIWNPKTSYSGESSLNFNNLIDSINTENNKQVVDYNNTKISFSNSKNLNNSMNDVKFDHQINKLTFSYSNHNIKENIFNTDINTQKLRFNKIEPTDKNITNFSSNYKLNKFLSFTTGHALGEFNNSNKFNESYYDINYQNNFYSLNYGYGTILEQNQFLGTEGTGAYKINKPSVTNFTDINSRFLVNKNLELTANYAKFNTDIDMMYKNFVSISNLQSDEFKFGITYHKLLESNDKLSLNFISPLSTTSGEITQYTTKGYNTDGTYKSLTEHYSLKNDNRQKNINLIYEYNLNSNLNFISAINYNENNLGQDALNNLGLYQGLSFTF